MAEAAGLAIGVAALIGTVKDCIDLFGYISASRDFGRDYQVLATQLEVAKILLLQWVYRVHLFDQNDNLLDPTTTNTASQVLSSIQHLLGDAQNLQDKYGLRDETSSTSSGHRITNRAASRHDHVLSESRMDRFYRDFKNITVRADVSTTKKIRWAVHDKDKFDVLIQKLMQLISSLNQIIPDSCGTMLQMIREDLRSLRLQQLQLVPEASRGHQPPVTDAVLDELTTRNILECLWYRMIDDRKAGVRPAHEKTFKWALNGRYDESSTECEWHPLSSWLANGSGIYWVSGKAGSGKSTLMKYLYDLGETRNLLVHWAGSDLTMAHFFFYGLGVPEQKTQEGLERAILYQILSAEPSLTPDLLPRMWREVRSMREVRSLQDDKPIVLPSPAEMSSAFVAIRNGLRSPRKFCFFIDGLDEYYGKCEYGISTIKLLAESPNIKVIVSSRPTSSCVSAFSRFPKLQLQYLTRQDIWNYIHDVIGSDPYLKDLFMLNPHSISGFCTEIASKASGVFLWVFLACNSVKSGFAANDNLEELQQRIEELPPELEDLFRHILEKIERRYRIQGAKTLRVCYTNHLYGGLDIPSLGMAIVEEANFKLHKTVPSPNMSKEMKQIRCGNLEGRIRSRCGGLLEINHCPQDDSNSFYCFCDESKTGKGHNTAIDTSIVFIHRTVVEFLGRPDIWEIECLQTDDLSFEPHTILTRLYLELAQHGIIRRNYLKSTFKHAQIADSLPTVKGIADVMLYVGQVCPGLIGQFQAASHAPKASFPFTMSITIEAGMLHSIKELLKRSEAHSHLSPKLLYHALVRPRTSHIFVLSQEKISEMVFYLLSLGIDPNKTFSLAPGGYSGITAWTYWAHHCMRPDTYPCYSVEAIVEITLWFLEAGGSVYTGKGYCGVDLERLESRLKGFIDSNHLKEISEESSEEHRRVFNTLRKMKNALITRLGSEFPAHQWFPSVPCDVDDCASSSKRRRSTSSDNPTKRAKTAGITDT